MDLATTLIVGFIIFYLLFGPDRLKDIARMLGQATREFQKASKDVLTPLQQTSSDIITPLKQTSSEILAPLQGLSSQMTAPLKGVSSQMTAPRPPITEEGLLRDTANKLGINIEGKTTSQLAEEIVRRAGEISRKLPPKEEEVKAEVAM
ncbi:MAG TPA: twin-arginine translocase TatA/TatE family subunit [archaeon]|nr:twin-arginine translocase TatA/TatE family subunit [archaeon]